jgi:copper chaperone NosL
MRFFAGTLILFFLSSCSVEPEPLVFYGTDVCYSCKMTLMDNRFGAEIVTKKGKVYKFDDINCFVNFHNSGSEPEENMAYRLVIDYESPGNLIDAVNSFYVKSDTLRTPMGSGIAAFSIGEDYKAYKKKWNGILLSWGEVVTEYK